MKKRLPQVKIIGGNFKGFKIQFIPNKLIRPTSNKTRETLFNWLMHDIQKAQCLDMFAGTGAIGLEALSRGAEFVFFVEKNKNLCESIQKNLNILSLEKKAKVINADSLKKDFKKEIKKSLDIVFLDPPFRKNLISRACNLLEKQKILIKKSLVYAEYEKELIEEENLIGLNMIKGKVTGQTMFNLYRKDEV